MAADKKAPEIRFKGFKDEWEERKLSEIATMHARIGWQNLRTSEFLDSGDYMLITGTDFDDGRINYATCHYVEKDRYEQDKHIQIQNGSVLITKDGTLGKVAYVQGLSMPATLNAGVFNVVIKDKSEVDERYLFQYLKAPYLMDYVSKKATGGTIKHLNQNILVEFLLAMPKVEEQALAGELFRGIDNLIAHHQQEHDKTVNIKKAMLEKMFPKEGGTKPEIRFKGFSGEWEERKLGDITNILSASRVHKEEWVPSGVPFFRSSDVVSALKKTDNLKAFISYKLFEQLSQISGRPEKDDIFLTGGGTIGIPYIVPNNEPLYSKDADLIWVKKSEAHNSHYLYNLFLTFCFRIYINSISHIGTIAHYTIEQVKDTPVYLPEISEQSAIGSFFQQLDKLINSYRQELDKLKNIKKALLEKMFV